IDAVRTGARVLEMPVAMEHRHTGRHLAGFRHRGGQGLDIARALWPRLADERARLGVIAGALALFLTVALVAGTRWAPTSRPRGDLAVVGYAKQIRLIAGNHVGSEPGALGDALRRSGLVTAVVGNADAPGSEQPSLPEVNRPVAMALVDRTASVRRGEVGPELLQGDPVAPYGVRFDEARVLAETHRALQSA